MQTREVICTFEAATNLADLRLRTKHLASGTIKPN